jgi:glycosyltransferase involved in cell wall biosynthesis
MLVWRLTYTLAVKLADAVITEIIDPMFEDPIKLKYSRIRLPIALRFIDIERFNILKPVDEREYGIGFVGRLEPEKGLPEFVLSIKLLYLKGYRPRVIIVGGGSLYNFAKRELNQFGVNVLSYVPHDQMPNIYNSMKILVLPSKKEGVPTVLLEALACGVIPVVSKVGGMPWVVKRAGSGIILDNPSIASIFTALSQLLSLEPEKLRDLSLKGRKFVEEYFSLEKAVSRYSLLRKI